MATSSAGVAMKTPSTKRGKRGKEPPLPRPFDLPLNFPASITASLEGKRLVGRPRTKFFTIIAHSIYRFKDYPTDEEYLYIVQEMFKKWPFLNDGKGLVSQPDRCTVNTIIM